MKSICEHKFPFLSLSLSLISLSHLSLSLSLSPICSYHPLLSADLTNYTLFSRRAVVDKFLMIG